MGRLKKGALAMDTVAKVLIFIVGSIVIFWAVFSVVNPFKSFACESYCSLKGECDRWRGLLPKSWGDAGNCLRGGIIDVMGGSKLPCKCCWEDSAKCGEGGKCIDDTTLQTGECSRKSCEMINCVKEEKNPKAVCKEVDGKAKCTVPEG